MSFQNQGRKVQPEKRKNFPEHLEEIYNSESLEFAATIAQTLHLDFGETGKSIKTVMKYTGAGERTVKNWFQGKNGPNGENLIKLMRHSDKILNHYRLASVDLSECCSRY